jgi:sulfite exporter TauE/SafE
MAWVHLAAMLRVAAGSVLLVLALRVAFGWNAFAWLERAGGRLWSRYLMKLAPGAVQRGGFTQAIVLGALWGWLPCGLVYSMLIFAAFAGSAANGAYVMLAFGAGTLPAMLASNLLASQLARALSKPAMRPMAAALLTAFGIWTIVAGLAHGGHH